MMGCVGSRNVNDSNVFRVVPLPSTSTSGSHNNNAPHTAVEGASGQLEVTSTHLTLYRKRKPTITWPLQCLRRYGYENDTFIFEAGRRCKTGEGIYSFRCQRAEALFLLLQEHIQESTYNNNNNLIVNLDGDGGGGGGGHPPTPESMDAEVNELRRSLGHHQQQTTTTNGSNYIILHGNSGVAAGGGEETITSHRGQMAMVNNGASPCSNSPPYGGGASSSQNHNNNSYLEPVFVASTTNSSTMPTAIAPNNSSNIYVNSMVMPASGTTGTVNVYQQLSLAHSSRTGIDGQKPQTDALQTPGTPGSCGSGNSSRPVLANSESLMRLRASMSAEEMSSGPSQTTSPVPVGEVTTPLIHNTYMNVTPGEMVLLASCASAANQNSSSSNRSNLPNATATASSVTTPISERCYENFDAAQFAAALNGSPTVMGRPVGRHSRPDIFSKVDLPMADCGAGARISEPCTPTSASVLVRNITQQQQRKVNYIVLDLDSGGGGGTGATPPVDNAVPTVGLLSPESPKKREPLGYATIDFNKTVALSNSTNPTSESSRRTRF